MLSQYPSPFPNCKKGSDKILLSQNLNTREITGKEKINIRTAVLFIFWM
jgi:hypothetical protein